MTGDGFPVLLAEIVAAQSLEIGVLPHSW